MNSENLIQVSFDNYYFSLTPNCLMTKKPVLFVGPRWQWGIIPNFIREHGYDVYCLQDFWPSLINKSQYHWFDIQEYRNCVLHSETQFKIISFFFEAKFIPKLIKKMGHYFLFQNKNSNGVFKNQIQIAQNTFLPLIQTMAEEEYIQSIHNASFSKLKKYSFKNSSLGKIQFPSFY